MAPVPIFNVFLFIIALICSTDTIPADSSIDTMLPENTVLYIQSGRTGLDAALQFATDKLQVSGEEESANDMLKNMINSQLAEFAKATGVNPDELRKALNSVSSAHFAITGFRATSSAPEPVMLFAVQTDTCAFFENLLKSAESKSILEETDKTDDVKIYCISENEGYENIPESLDFVFEGTGLFLCTVKNKYLCLSNDIGTLKSFAAAAKTPPAKSLGTNAKYLKTRTLFGDKDMLRAYFDFAAFKTGWEDNNRSEGWLEQYYQTIFEGFDFDTLGSVGMASSKSGGKFTSKTAFFIQDENGFAKTFFCRPAAGITLSAVMPADCIFVILANTGNGKALWTDIKKWLSDTEPYLFPNEDVLGEIKMAEESLNATFEEIADCTAGEAALYVKSGGDFGFEAGFACTVKNIESAGAIAKKMEPGLSGENIEFSEKKYKNITVRFNDGERFGEFANTAYCFLDNRFFVFSSSCETLEQIIDDFSNKKTLAFTEEYKKKTAFLPDKMSKMFYMNIKKESSLTRLIGSDEVIDMLSELAGSVSYSLETPGQVTVISDSPLGITGIFFAAIVSSF